MPRDHTPSLQHLRVFSTVLGSVKESSMAPRKDGPRKDQPANTQAKTTSKLRPLAEIGKVWADIGANISLEFRVSCVRPDDLLVCDFIFENLGLASTAEGKPKLIRRGTSTPVLIVEFPPQSFGEESFLDAAGETGQEVPADVSGDKKFPESADKVKPPVTPKNKVPPDPKQNIPPLPSSKIRMSGPSRLAFSMPDNETELAFTIEAILDACRRWPMRLDVNAVPDPPSLRVGREALFRDFWLGTVVNSNDWKEAKKILVNTIGAEHEKRLAAAARRITNRAVDALRAESPSNIDETLHEAVNEELDVLADKSKTFREEKGREVAAAAIAFMATENLTQHRLASDVLDLLKELPFVRLIFPPHKPLLNVTALELPYRLILSPVPDSRWHHHIAPVTRNGRTELWQTRLTSTKEDVGPDGPVRVRALWSDDYVAPDVKGNFDPAVVARANRLLPFRMSLDPLDRLMLVALMSGFDLDARKADRPVPYRPTTANSRRLSLSSLGALCEIEGEWPPPVPPGVGLEQWRHVATLGRDHYVRVVYKGFLCHPRHAASLVKVTERKFEFMPGTKDRVAVLRQRFFIVVRERLKTYDGIGHRWSARNLPFTDIEILTKVTPTLLAPDLDVCNLKGDLGIYNAIPKRACFWPMLGDPQPGGEVRDFLFDMAGTDHNGDRVRFSMPLLFVGKEANDHGHDKEPPQNLMTRIRTAYNKESTRRSTSFGGATIAYAPPKAGAKGDPKLPTRTLSFLAGPVEPVITTDEAQFYPEAHFANTDIAAVRRLLQKQDASVELEYAEAYMKFGFGAGNPGEVFLKVRNDALALSFGGDTKSDSIGGLATPSMSILGLSRVMGPVAAQKPSNPTQIENSLKAIIDNQFNPADFFKDAKILGGINIGEIILGLAGLGNEEVPKLLSRETAEAMEASFDWTTAKIQGDHKGMFLPNNGGQTTLEMHGVVSARKDGSAPSFSATAILDHFKLNLFGFVTLWFDRLKFTSRSGQKPDVAVDLHSGQEAVKFGGPLEFVNELRKIIPSNGFSDPPSLIVTPSGISAGYSLSLPSLAVGIFALEHVSLGAGFMLPFDAKPAEVRFNFAERQRPFSLTVSLLGGGGFFAIGLGSEGVREIEASLEFGAALSINLGVASGSVEVKAGVYYHWKSTLVELEGYVRLHGELSVLGLISASLTFYLALGFTKESGKSVVWGEASLEVEIDILFLSFSVKVSCRREFGGSPGDPKFIELIPDQTTWDEYCAAFAEEAA